jgi:hypothetical protein
MTAEHAAMDQNLTYAACGLLIIAYAWTRFNTPPSNRSSTRQTLYWSSAVGYMLSVLVLFAALSALLDAGPWRKLLLGQSNDPALPAPLIATLAMTTLLPAVPTLKRLDEWFLSIFLDWAEIPGEVRRRAAVMTLENFNVTSEDVAALRQSYQEAGYGDTLVRHLRRRGGDGLGQSQARLTRVVKLYDCICKLAGEPRYSHFFSEAANEFDELDRKATDFLRRAAIGLTLAERMRAAEKEGTYDELIRERREDFANSCRDMFRVLALFLARAVLRSETSEMGVVRRLRAIGFDAAGPMNLPRFPIHSLTVLALGVFVYLLVAIVFFNRVMATSEQQNAAGLMTAVKVTSIRLGTIALTVWLMQRYPFFRRAAGDPPRFFAYVLNGLIAAAVAAGIGLMFHPGNPDPLTAGDVAPILLSSMMCTALALCCDDWVADTMPPRWLRLAEAAACAVAVALGMALIVVYLPEALKIRSDKLVGLTLVMLFAFPSALALMIGGCVPHIYRSARRAAIARRDEASQLFIPALPAPQPSAIEGFSVGSTENGRRSGGERQEQRAEIIHQQAERPVIAGLTEGAKAQKHSADRKASPDLRNGHQQGRTAELLDGKCGDSAADSKFIKPGKRRNGSVARGARRKQLSGNLDGATNPAAYTPA